MKNKIILWILGIIIIFIIGFSIWFFILKPDITPIGKIFENPRSFTSKFITIKGEVLEKNSLVLVKYFIIADNTGEIRVVTRKALPSIGEKICVRGRIKVFDVGPLQGIVLIEK